MDPSYSVLIGEPKCEEGNIKDSVDSNVLVIAVTVPIISIVVLVIFAVLILPKLRVWYKVKVNKQRNDMNELPEMREIQIEKVDAMEVNTAAGHFSVTL